MSDAYAFVKRRRGISCSARLVLISIAEYCDENGRWAPSVKRIASDTELSERTVITALDALQKANVITRERQASASGRRTADRITLVGFADFLASVNALTEKDKSPSANSSRANDDKMQSDHVKDLHVVKMNGHAPETTTKPSDEEFALSPPPAVPQRRSRAKTKKENSPTPPIRKNLSPSQSSGERGGERPHSMPEDWQPSAQARDYARRLKFQDWEITAAAIECRDYWLDRPKEKRPGWDRTFQRLLRDLVDDRARRAKLKHVSGHLNGSATTSDAEWRRRLANYECDGSWSSSYGPRPGQSGYQGPPISQQERAA